MTVTIDLPSDVAEALTQKAAQEGSDVAGYVRHLAVLASDAPTADPKGLTPRLPGLHAGRYWIADDFDAPLPESFWLGPDDESGQ